MKRKSVNFGQCLWEHLHRGARQTGSTKPLDDAVAIQIEGHFVWYQDWQLLELFVIPELFAWQSGINILPFNMNSWTAALRCGYTYLQLYWTRNVDRCYQRSRWYVAGLNYYKTRKSSCVTARGILPAAYPVHGMSNPRGYPYPVGRYLWPRTWLGYPPPATDLTGYPTATGLTGYPPPLQTWLGYPTPPLERTWDQRLGTPCGQKHACENITFPILRMPAVINCQSNKWEFWYRFRQIVQTEVPNDGITE